MLSPGTADPVKYPLAALSLHVPAGFQCQASTVNSVFWRNETGCQPEAIDWRRDSGVKSPSMAATGIRSMPAPKVWFGTK